jgi:uncharacterized protein
MTIVERISSELNQAMKERDALRVATLRLVKSALKNQEIEAGGPLDDEAAVRVLTRLTNQRKESVEQYEKGGRPDLAERERAELAILADYMPAGVDEAEIRTAIFEVVAKLGSPSPREMGTVMKEVMARFKGRPADGRLISQLVKQALGG